MFMDKHFSLYLDLVRFSAAVLVVLAHFVQHGIVGPLAAAWIPNYGREAVVVFFVLSGYVIAYTSSKSPITPSQYVIARCARIYSVALPCVLLAFIFLFVCHLMFGSPGGVDYRLARAYAYIPFHLMFLGELWNLSEVPPSLAQYWSLGYEVWYYVLFGVLFFLRGRARLLVASLVALVMGPKLLLLLPVWFSGVYLYRTQKDLSGSTALARAGCLATLIALIALKTVGAEDQLRALGTALWPFPSFKLGSADRYLADYVTCALIFLHFKCARQAQFGELAILATPIRAFASYTFTLYLIHGLVMGLWSRFYHHDQSDWRDILYLSLAIAAATYVLGFLTERRKRWFVHAFEGMHTICVKFLGRSPRPPRLP